MKKVINQWLALTLAIGALVSCGEDRHEPSSTAEGSGETVTLSLSAEVSVDDADLRAINYKLGTNAKGQLVPLPQFSDGELVDVHTILKSSRAGSVPVAKTLKWRYDAQSKKLVLAPKVKFHGAEYTNDITIADFNNDGGVKWYVSGMIGGFLVSGSTRVVMSTFGPKVLRGTSNTAGDIIGSLDVPYAFPWTELTILTSSKKEGTSYSSAEIVKSADVRFTPLGSLVAFKLGTDQVAGAYTFKPDGFTVRSNAFGDAGTFDLNVATPGNGTPSVLPKWTEQNASFARRYSFAPGQEPGVINHGQSSDKTYYAWMMPHSTQPNTVSIRVMMTGDSNRYINLHDKAYHPKIWYTDYKVKQGTTKLVQGRVHILRANASYPIYLPIQYVTEYNLAGGDGLTFTVNPGTRPGFLNSPEFGGKQPVGVMGPLRFANYDADGQQNDYGHRNDASGYYNWYKVMGIKDYTHNPNGKSLQNEIDNLWGKDKYIVPNIIQWHGVFPFGGGIANAAAAYEGGYGIKNTADQVAFGRYPDLQYVHGKADYSPSFQDGANAVLYSIRFKSAGAYASTSFNHTVSGLPFEPLTDDAFKCAYRYTRIGSRSDWDVYHNDVVTHKVVVDVVYLGENSEDLEEISNPDWWAKKEAEGLVISKTFGTTGGSRIEDVTNTMKLNQRPTHGYYWSTTPHSYESHSAYGQGLHGFYASIFDTYRTYSQAIRLFHVDLN